MVDALILLIFPAAMAFSAASDLITMTISNRVSLTLVAAFMLMAFLTAMPLATIGMHLLAGALVLLVTFAFFARGWMGGGDAKLAAATALWLGPEQTFTYVLLASMLGGMLTLMLLSVRSHRLHPAFLLREQWYLRLTHEKTGIPYGIALAAAGLVVYPHSYWMGLLGQ